MNSEVVHERIAWKRERAGLKSKSADAGQPARKEPVLDTFDFRPDPTDPRRDDDASGQIDALIPEPGESATRMPAAKRSSAAIRAA